MEPGLYATLETDKGRIVVRLFEKEVPKWVEILLGLV
jgi:cyclophilin family peptidyl-prolyl cis-trans isomerase